METEHSPKISTWLFHAVVWIALLALPFYSILPGRPIVDGQGYAHFVIVVLSFMIVFYVNWFFLLDRFLSSKRIGRFTLWNLLLVTCISILTHLVFTCLLIPPESAPDHPHDDNWFTFIRFLIGNSFFYLLVVFVSVAVRMTAQWFKAENMRKDLEKSRTETELKHLKSQLNPHFLFNTLNNIYSLIQIDSTRAQSAVYDLSQLLRYVLYDSASPTVPFSSEVTFLKEYIALMRIRMPRHVDLKVSLPEHPSDTGIAPMLFISLIENAFKHGVSPDKTSFIHITIRETADVITCFIENSNHPKADMDRSDSGIGLKNLKQRLDMIYGGHYTFSYGISGETYRCQLEMIL